MAASGEAWSYVLSEINGSILAHRVCGEGQPLVFLHGFGTTSASWLRCAEMISGRYRKILLDLPGHGRSGRTIPAEGAVEYCVEVLTAFLRRADMRQCVVAAHSFGGYLLLRALLDNHIDPPRLFLVDVPAFPQRLPKVVDFFAGSINSSLTLAVTPWELLTWAGQVEVFCNVTQIPMQLVKEYANSLRVPGTVDCLHHLATAIRSEINSTTPLALERLSTPTFILWGSDDRLVPLDSGRKLHEAILMSKLHILPATGHAPQEESPQEAAALIQLFLEEIH